jgi:hypothetical protein
MRRNTSVHFKQTENAPDTLVNDSGDPLNLVLGGVGGVTLIVDEESGIFTLTISDSEEVEE